LILTSFTTVQGHNCILGNAYNTLRHLNLSLREQDLFFWFSAFHGSRIVSEMFDTLFEKKTKTNWQIFVEQCIEDQQPVLVHIDPKALPYVKHNVFVPSIGHYINIIGIEIGEKKLCVSDGYVPTYSPSTYTGWIDFSAVTNSYINACWRIKLSALTSFFKGSGEAEILEFTRTNIIRRLSEFLLPDEKNHKPSGIVRLRNLPDTIYVHVRDENYMEIFKLLAGIRLHIINPLVYLRLALERHQNQYQEQAKSLGIFINTFWDIPYMQLIKFSIAHKRINCEGIATQIREAVLMEETVLNTLIENLMTDKKATIERI